MRLLRIILDLSFTISAFVVLAVLIHQRDVGHLALASVVVFCTTVILRRLQDHPVA
jgi:hypothetical protein